MTQAPHMPPDTRADIDAIRARLAEGTQPEDLADQLLACIALLADRASADSDALSGLLRQIHLRLMQDQLPRQAALARAQFAARHYQRETVPTTRLHGEARAMGKLLGQALDALPKRHSAQIFDAGHYLAQNPDVADAGADARRHYIDSGADEGRRPAPLGVARSTCRLADLPVSDRPVSDRADANQPGFIDQYSPALREEMLETVRAARPAVSVIIPSWNRGHMLGWAVSTALLQSYAPTEVIVVDDGSDDGTAERLAADFPEPLDDGRLVLLKVPHGGVSAARNAGLARAQGDIIAYLDSDNQWESDHLLVTCAALCDPARATAEAAYSALCRHNLGDGWSDVLFQPFTRDALEDGNFIDLNAFVHRRALYDRLGGFDTGLSRLVDWDLILRYTAGRAPLALPVITAHYLQSGAVLGNISAVEPLAPNIARIRAKLAGDSP